MQMKSYSISASFSHPFPFPFSFIFLTFARWSGQHLSEVHADEDLQHVSVVFSSFSISILFHFVTPSPGGVASIWARGVQMRAYSMPASFSHLFPFPYSFIFLTFARWSGQHLGKGRADEVLQHFSVFFSFFFHFRFLLFFSPLPGGVASNWARGVQKKSYSMPGSFSQPFTYHSSHFVSPSPSEVASN